MKCHTFYFRQPLNDRTYFGTHPTRYARIRGFLNDDEEVMASIWLVFHPQRTAKALQRNGIVLEFPTDLEKDGFLRIGLDNPPQKGMNVTDEQEFALLELLVDNRYIPSPLMIRYFERHAVVKTTKPH